MQRARAMEHHIPSSFIPKKLGGNGWTCLDLLVFVEEGCAACYGLTALIVFNMFGFLCACVEFMPGNLLRGLRAGSIEEVNRGET